jgi:hypothetical protein
MEALTTSKFVVQDRRPHCWSAPSHALAVEGGGCSIVEEFERKVLFDEATRTPEAINGYNREVWASPGSALFCVRSSTGTPRSGRLVAELVTAFPQSVLRWFDAYDAGDALPPAGGDTCRTAPATGRVRMVAQIFQRITEVLLCNS